MKLKTKILIWSCLILLFVTSSKIFALTLDVRVYSEYKLTEFAFTAISGKYTILADDKKLTLQLYKNNPLELKIIGNKIQIVKNKESLGLYDKISFENAGLVNAFKINTNIAKSPERIYDDELRLSIVNGNIQLINRVDLERYVAGVVQSEIMGSSNEIEFFKIQAIIARTYTLSNIMKHSKDGYNLCDGTHCQSYLRRCNNRDIMMAVSQTFCDVIIDKNGKLISAAFHSNSGGQTQNSENVWAIPTTYLKSVSDTFSLNMRNSTWEKKIPKKQWVDYFKNNYKYLSNDPIKIQKLFSFQQPKRQQFIIDSIPLRIIRNHFNLKSTFFSSIEEGENIILKGKGYGHGVGLSQEGAINMVQHGYKYEDIIKYYYKNVEVVKYTEIIKF